MDEYLTLLYTTTSADSRK